MHPDRLGHITEIEQRQQFLSLIIPSNPQDMIVAGLQKPRVCSSIKHRILPITFLQRFDAVKYGFATEVADAPEDEDGLVDSMRAEVYEDGPRRGQPVFTPAVALSFMVFVLLYFPCVATIGTLKRETNGKWAAFTVVHSLVLAWVAAFLVFRIVSLF